MEYPHGWYQIALQRDLVSGLNAAYVGQKRLAIWTDGYRVRTFSGDCPHRGADLTCAEVVKGQITCPFHGYKIGLSRPSADGYQTTEYQTFIYGGMVLACLSGTPVTDVPKALPHYLDDLQITPVFDLTIRAPISLIMENGFDSAHFKAVHRISNLPEFEVLPGTFGEFVVGGTFEMPNPIGPGSNSAEYRAWSFGPGFAFTALKGAYNHYVISGVTPTRNHRPDAPECTMRISFGFEKDKLPPQWLFEKIIAESRLGLALDTAIWEGMNMDVPPKWHTNDEAVVQLHKFLQQFRERTSARAAS